MARRGMKAPMPGVPRVPKTPGMPNASAQGIAHGKPFQGGGFNPPGRGADGGKPPGTGTRFLGPPTPAPQSAVAPRLPGSGFTGGFTPPGNAPMNIPPTLPMPGMPMPANTDGAPIDPRKRRGRP